MLRYASVGNRRYLTERCRPGSHLATISGRLLKSIAELKLPTIAIIQPRGASPPLVRSRPRRVRTSMRHARDVPREHFGWCPKSSDSLARTYSDLIRPHLLAELAQQERTERRLPREIVFQAIVERLQPLHTAIPLRVLLRRFCDDHPPPETCRP
jgi:hypothetical protein